MTSGEGRGVDAFCEEEGDDPRLGTLFDMRYIVTQGDPNRPVLLFLGALGRWIFQPIATALAGRYSMIQVEFPGFEEDDPTTPLTEEVSIEGLVRDVVEILDDEGARRVVGVGWSFGAQVAVSLGKTHADRIAGMVLICGVAGRPFSEADPAMGVDMVKSAVPKALDWLTGHTRRVAKLRTVFDNIENPARWVKRFGLIDPFTDERLFNEMIRSFLAVDLSTYNRYTRAMAEHDDSAALSLFSFPVLAVSGERDLLVPPERMADLCRSIPDCEYFEVIGGTHYLPIEYGDLLALKIDTFVKDYCTP